MIQGVKIKQLRRISDERGSVWHMLRRDDPEFIRFGEIYFSTVYPGAVKAWHFHKRMTLNYAVVAGMIKLVLYDNRKKSSTRGELMEIYAGSLQYNLITVPPMIWNGFKGIGTEMAVVANCSTLPYVSHEIIRMDPQNNTVFNYDWNRKMF